MIAVAARLANVPTARMMARALLRCPLEYCTVTADGDMVNSTRAEGATPAASSRASTRSVIRWMRAVMRATTTWLVGPLAWTMSDDSGKLSAHWPPVLGRSTDHPS